ncbi:hypothetical protein [Mycobacterium nebraskense]|uniref:Transmembrane protein n=1 Tax=Mycobacterium nebraskense TaxID=244292 RepID=A0A1X1ZQP2_9MYCO|nr:hypothetical protein [Mycobacterium nebraskense]KKC05230.1 hypothetical protein WU83_09610 [Mycobacterium nebraskense]MBI2696689.1 hypothetical protein [Mycobacterium nebraskense]MCV7117947.1 hypothetical protein [Mycobacterium nebraskense]ORW25632.1 hypothetical protein AWC17_01655 [Mycobacterium nebraskense]
MLKRGPLVFSAAVVALTVGFFALRFPVFIDAYDQFGWQVKCGSGLTTDLTQASSADQKMNEHGVARSSTNYVGRCDNALMIRRAWAIPVAALGGLTLMGLAAVVLAHDRRNIRS